MRHELRQQSSSISFPFSTPRSWMKTRAQLVPSYQLGEKSTRWFVRGHKHLPLHLHHLFLLLLLACLVFPLTILRHHGSIWTHSLKGVKGAAVDDRRVRTLTIVISSFWIRANSYSANWPILKVRGQCSKQNVGVALIPLSNKLACEVSSDVQTAQRMRPKSIIYQTISENIFLPVIFFF